jgi:hypothetical protein
MRRLSVELEAEVRRLAARGHGLREIGRCIGRSKHARWGGPIERAHDNEVLASSARSPKRTSARGAPERSSSRATPW